MELPLSRERVFPFFANAENLGRITPPELRFRLESPVPIAMQEGAVIDYTIRLWGWPLRWRSVITRWNPPEEFVDEQAVGPYRRWVHRHRMLVSPSGTRIEDEVTYELPWGRLGWLLAPLVRRQLLRIFEYRRQAIVRCFQEGD